MTLWRKRQIRQSQHEADIFESIITVLAIIGGVFLFMSIVALILI